MNAMPPSQTGDLSSITQSVLPNKTGFHNGVPAIQSVPESLQLGPRRAGYGLPCAKCKTYYAADLSTCPVCKTADRVVPMAIVTSTSTQPAVETCATAVPEDAMLEEERERFLREFKSQAYASHTQINVAESFRCSLEDNHQGAFEPAAVCQSCYVRLQERVDLLEAALHIDLKDATQIVYDAVWSDPSDSSKTYHNAAYAILAELRNRAGISLVIGPLKPLAH